MTFLMTAQGKPVSEAGFTNWFRDMATDAGLPVGLSPHGLRKAACARLADAGRSAAEIMSIRGHRNLAEVQTYERRRAASAPLRPPWIRSRT
ncbi:MAG: hypothetical protein EOQ98_04000 [Mesorhizobium sp.]|uniref:tyrosine-type recombinase/integrase n=1 Tax=Mesorhizobium sp. TaxID=1871066 RepID=UPI000FE71C29|nr:tyrosine-type recombinase/integrase [Mesorhizobium sp.]RWP02385.1 MAG: hypothetical protein EOQ98_04000 [Mesorhizobium sp.]TIM49948.1 MAG: phage integrase family protein [Mesorhizobium sp.]